MIRVLSVIIIGGCLGAAMLGGIASAVAQSSGLPLPRFVSLRSDQVNMRSGPGVRYPVDWVYLRRNLPVEVIAEFDTWRKIRDPDGAEGWVHQSMLAGRRTVFVRTGRAPLRRTADDEGMPAALIEDGVVGRLMQCPTGSEFCRVEIAGFQGWLKREEFWGVYRTEFVE
ncbi:MAG: SH3 domain-containing protein [Rhodospirillaceae bacterium]